MGWVWNVHIHAFVQERPGDDGIIHRAWDPCCNYTHGGMLEQRVSELGWEIRATTHARNEYGTAWCTVGVVKYRPRIVMLLSDSLPYNDRMAFHGPKYSHTTNTEHGRLYATSISIDLALAKEQ